MIEKDCNRENGAKAEGGLERLDLKVPGEKPVIKDGGRWRDIFDNITYSSGPGDNIYVWG